MICPNLLNTPKLEAGFYTAEESRHNPPPFLMNQVHSADVMILTDKPNKAPTCDALVTKEKGLQLTIKTADCAPILLADTEHQIVAAVHAGWKGAFQGVIENAILAMLSQGAHIQHIKAAIGPHLTQKNFQVAPEMQALFPITEQSFFQKTSTGIYFDFTNYLKHRLNRAGILDVEIIAIDTYTDLAYNSYRRNPQNPARQYSYIIQK